MKKAALFFVLVLVVAFSVITGCKKSSSPSGPVATNVPTPIASYTDLASVPQGTYTQEDTNGNSFTATVSAFKMGEYMVTYDLWTTVYKWATTTSAANTTAYSFQNAGWEGSTNAGSKYQPVTVVSWRDAIVWCNAYSKMIGLTPVYCWDAAYAQPITTSVDAAYNSSIDPAIGGIDAPYVNPNANGYRLPTESQYQCAASYIDGSNWTSPYFASGATDNTSDATATEAVAWYSADCSSTQIVGTKAANTLGIYDMSGNAFEWCWDWQSTYPNLTTQTNYSGLATGSYRVTRSGSFNYNAANMAVGYRGNAVPYDIGADMGFRVVRTY